MALGRGRFVSFWSLRRLPQANAYGVPVAVMKKLAWEQLPLDKKTYQRRLQELLVDYKLNNGGRDGSQRQS
jgi:hypothetical protein